MKVKIESILGVCGGCVMSAMAPAVLAQAMVAEMDQLDISNFPGALVEDVVVPVPSEIFTVLDKLGDPDWRSQLYQGEFSGYTDRTQLALLFGAAVADGFVAVQAEDQSGIERLGRDVLRLAEAIGIKEAVVEHTNSIIESARQEDWRSIRRELDRTQSTVRSTMERMRDEDLAQCVSIGGWLRGTEVITTLISDAYSKDKAELLSQPDLVEYFSRSINKMGEGVRTNDKVTAVDAGLGSIKKLMVNAGDSMGADVVEEIRGVCEGVLKAIRSQGGTAEGESSL